MDKQDTIIVNLTELYKVIRQMRKDNMYLVRLQIVPPDDGGGEPLPAALSFTGVSSIQKDFLVDYDPIDAVDFYVSSIGISSMVSE